MHKTASQWSITVIQYQIFMNCVAEAIYRKIREQTFKKMSFTEGNTYPQNPKII